MQRGDNAPPATEPGRLRQAALALLREMALAARWRLHRVGISINPYYWSQEGAFSHDAPVVLDATRYRFERSELHAPGIDAVFPAECRGHLEQCREHDWALYCMYEGDRIVSFMSLRFDEAPVFGRRRRLGAGEAYIILIYTVPDARGRGIAARLRHLCFDEMSRSGVTRLYSFIDTMNEAGLRTARKVGLRPLEKWLHIGLGRLHWHIPLRRRLN